MPDPCEESTANCLAVDVQGTRDFDTLQLDLSGATTLRYTWPPSAAETFSPPVVLAVPLPMDAAGAFSLSAVALFGDQLVERGQVTGQLVAGAHGKVLLRLQTAP